MDKDCAGDLVCESGECVAPSAAASVAAPTVPTPADAPAIAPAPAPASVLRAAPLQEEQPRDLVERQEPPASAPRSVPMMASGIVMIALAPFALMYGVGGAFSNCGGRDCDGGQRALLGLAGTGALLGIGIPLLVKGARRVPERRPDVSLVPAFGPRAGGVDLHLLW